MTTSTLTPLVAELQRRREHVCTLVHECPDCGGQWFATDYSGPVACWRQLCLDQFDVGCEWSGEAVR